MQIFQKIALLDISDAFTGVITKYINFNIQTTFVRMFSIILSTLPSLKI